MRSAPKGSEISRYDILQQVEKTTGETPKDLLETPELRPEHAHAWELFNKLGEYSFQEIDAYSRLTGDHVKPWESEAIMVLSKHIGEDLQQWPPKLED